MAVKEKEIKFPISEFLEHAEGIGVNKYLAYGAFYGQDLTKLITKKEFKNKVEEYSRKVVK